MTSASFVLLLLALSDEPSPVVVLGSVAGEGMSDADLDAARARLAEELTLMGAQVPTPDRGRAAGGTPLLEPAASADQDAEAILDVTLVRVGPILQVQAQLRSVEGEVLVEVDRSVNADTLGRDTLLGPEVAKAVRGLWAVNARPPVETPAAEGARASPAPAPGPPGSADGAAANAAVDAEAVGGAWWWAPLLAGGAAVAGAGALVAVAGLVVSLQQTFVAYTPTTPGSHKALALVIAPAALAAAATGVALLAVGLGGAAGAVSASLLVGE